MNHGEFYKADELVRAVHRERAEPFAGFRVRLLRAHTGRIPRVH